MQDCLGEVGIAQSTPCRLAPLKSVLGDSGRKLWPSSPLPELKLALEGVTRLIEAAGERGRHRLRDLLMFRHGLRAGEAVILRWDAIMFDTGAISIKRLKRREDGILLLGAI